MSFFRLLGAIKYSYGCFVAWKRNYQISHRGLAFSVFLLFFFSNFLIVLVTTHCVTKYIFFVSGMWLILVHMANSESSSFALKFLIHYELVKLFVLSFVIKYSKYTLTKKQSSQWKSIFHVSFFWLVFWVFCQGNVPTVSSYSIMFFSEFVFLACLFSFLRY